MKYTPEFYAKVIQFIKDNGNMITSLELFQEFNLSSHNAARTELARIGYAFSGNAPISAMNFSSKIYRIRDAFKEANIEISETVTFSNKHGQSKYATFNIDSPKDNTSGQITKLMIGDSENAVNRLGHTPPSSYQKLKNAGWILSVGNGYWRHPDGGPFAIAKANLPKFVKEFGKDAHRLVVISHNGVAAQYLKNRRGLNVIKDFGDVIERANFGEQDIENLIRVGNMISTEFRKFRMGRL